MVRLECPLAMQSEIDYRKNMSKLREIFSIFHANLIRFNETFRFVIK